LYNNSPTFLRLREALRIMRKLNLEIFSHAIFATFFPSQNENFNLNSRVKSSEFSPAESKLHQRNRNSSGKAIKVETLGT
jgi:hypothetical protein